MRRRVLLVVVLAAVATGLGSQQRVRAETVRPATTGFPASQPGAVVSSRQAGGYVLALGVSRAGGGATRVRVSVVGQQGTGTRGLVVRVGSLRAAPCGPGCYEATLATGWPRSVDVAVRGALTTRWRVALPRHAAPAGALVARAGRVWRGLRSLRIRDRLASDARHAIVTTWWMAAPDRLAYHVRGHGSAIVIGRRRWDRQAGGRWIASTQDPPLRQPAPFWVEVADAHVLGTTSFAGRPAWRISFYDPRTPAWFEIVVDRRTFRTLDLRMNTSAHFMHDTYAGFDAPTRIRPPAGG